MPRKTQEHDAAFVEYIVKSLVDTPDAVVLDRAVDEMGVLITLKVDPNDMGQIIGRDGSTAKAIRTLLRIVGAKNNARVNLKIIEPEGSERAKAEESGRAKPEAKPKVSEQNVDQVVDDLKL